MINPNINNIHFILRKSLLLQTIKFKQKPFSIKQWYLLILHCCLFINILKQHRLLEILLFPFTFENGFVFFIFYNVIFTNFYFCIYSFIFYLFKFVVLHPEIIVRWNFNVFALLQLVRKIIRFVITLYLQILIRKFMFNSILAWLIKIIASKLSLLV